MEDLSKLSKKELLARLNKKESQKIPEPEGRNFGGDWDAEVDKVERLAEESHPYKLELSVKEDPKSIMLYTAINKRVGPLHPQNARRTMLRWKRAGIQLYTTPRTAEQVEAFKKTPEYQVYHKKHLEDRARAHKASSRGRVENIAKDIAREAANIAVASKG